MSTDRKPLIVLTGPTAVGKTDLSIALAKAVNGEIVSCDSMQVYRGMDIGSAKIRPEETEGVPHHLIDVLDPDEDFDIVKFQRMALEAMDGIYERGNIPVLTGGTGFYIQAVTRRIDFTENAEDSSYRRELERAAFEKGPEYLHNLLMEADPESALAIHPNNIKRVIRALEFYHTDRVRISEHNQAQRQNETPYNLAYFVLNEPRELLYEKINLRVDQMMEDGLPAEVSALREKGIRKGMTSMQGIGYKEILAFLDGEYPLEEAVRVLKRNTRHFAKRQLTWFRREKDVIWIQKELFEYNNDNILEYIISTLMDKRIISS